MTGVHHDATDDAAGAQVTVLGRLAGRCYDHRRAVLVAWILALIGITVVAQVVGTHFQNKFTAGNTPSQQAANISTARFPAQSGDTADVVFHTTRPIAANGAAIDDVVPRSGRWPTCAASPARSRRPARTRSRRTGTSPTPWCSSTPRRITCRPRPSRPSSPPPRRRRTPDSTSRSGATRSLRCQRRARGERGHRHHRRHPHHAAGLRIGGGHGPADHHRPVRPRHRHRALELVTHFLVVPTFAPEMAAMIGIGVGIDYALFIVTRYRQGIFEGREPATRWSTSLMTSGRAVLFAGCTVVISLFGLFLIGQAYMIGLALGLHRRRADGPPGRADACCPPSSASPAKPSTGSTCPGLLQSGGPPPAERLLVPLEPGRPAPGVGRPAAAGRARAGRCWPSRCSACGWPSPTPATTPSLTPGRPTTCWPKDSARASTAAGGRRRHAGPAGPAAPSSSCAPPSARPPDVAFAVPPQYNAGRHRRRPGRRTPRRRRRRPQTANRWCRRCAPT